MLLMHRELLKVRDTTVGVERRMVEREAVAHDAVFVFDNEARDVISPDQARKVRFERGARHRERSGEILGEREDRVAIGGSGMADFDRWLQTRFSEDDMAALASAGANGLWHEAVGIRRDIVTQDRLRCDC